MTGIPEAVEALPAGTAEVEERDVGSLPASTDLTEAHGPGIGLRHPSCWGGRDNAGR